MLDIFKQAMKDALSLLGESALLRGDQPCQVNIEHSVHLEGLDFNPTVERYTTVHQDIVSIEASLNPKVGDTLRVGTIVDGAIETGIDYKLDALVVDSGPMRRFIIVKA